jgi:hypothetical protein
VVSVLRRVVLAGFLGVVRGVVEVAFRYVGMVAGFLVIASFMMFRGGVMMFRRVFVVLRSLAVVLRGILRHVQLSLDGNWVVPVSPEPGLKPSERL